jgi:hypothetical protein
VLDEKYPHNHGYIQLYTRGSGIRTERLCALALVYGQDLNLVPDKPAFLLVLVTDRLPGATWVPPQASSTCTGKAVPVHTSGILILQ